MQTEICRDLVWITGSQDKTGKGGSGGYVLRLDIVPNSPLSGFVGHSFIPASLMPADGHFHLFDSSSPSCVQGSNTPQPLSQSAPPALLHPSLPPPLPHTTTAQSQHSLEVHLKKTHRRDVGREGKRGRKGWGGLKRREETRGRANTKSQMTKPKESLSKVSSANTNAILMRREKCREGRWLGWRIKA